ncbi:hypothetical protein G153_13257, partial [Megasphaera sp. BL7]
MGRNEMIARARSAFREVLEAMETPHAQLLQRDPDIKGLVENIVQACGKCQEAGKLARRGIILTTSRDTTVGPLAMGLAA